MVGQTTGRKFEHAVQVYYEDTDHSGLVYHANYLKYMERAREHVLGVEALTKLWNVEGLGFAVYKAELTYKLGAVFGDALVVKTRIEVDSPYRALFYQDVYRKADDKLLVLGLIHLVCIDRDKKLVKLPESVVALTTG